MSGGLRFLTQNHLFGDLVLEYCPYMCIEQSCRAKSPNTNYVKIRWAVSTEHHCRGDHRAFKFSAVPKACFKPKFILARKILDLGYTLLRQW
jgi:hypothetical protein